jgi:phage recombination protein Bet
VEYTREQKDLIKRTVAPGVTDDELMMFLHACRVTGLDPLTRQIYAIKRPQQDEGGNWTSRMTIQTGIDGYRVIADRTECYAPGPETQFVYDEDHQLKSATAFVRKQTADGTWHEVSATAHYNEYVARKRDGQPQRMWADKPHVMLGKCAEALALRRAFPAQLSTVYVREEMAQTEALEDLSSHEPPHSPGQPPRGPGGTSGPSGREPARDTDLSVQARRSGPPLPSPAPDRLRQLLATCHAALVRHNDNQTDPVKKTSWWSALTWAGRRTGKPVNLGSPEDWLEPEQPEDLEHLVPFVTEAQVAAILESLRGAEK